MQFLKVIETLHLSSHAYDLFQPALIQPSDNKLTVANFDVVKVIGKGNGGIVHLVQHKWTSQFFALKAPFDRARKWVQELQAQGTPNMVMALVGNKSDLLDSRKVAAEEAQTYAQENDLFFMETSTKTATNVNDIFYEIAKRLPRLHQAPYLPNPLGMVLVDQPAERAAAT